MQKSTWKLAGLGGLGALMMGTALVVVGCGDDPAGVPAAEPGKQQCGRSVVAMSGQQCSQEGQVCPIPIACDAETKQVANCTCQGGTFSCTDTAGNPYDGSGTEPVCSEITPAPSVDCGGSPDTLEGKACEVIRSSCRYLSPTCEGEFAGQYDVCDCKLNSAGVQAWICLRNSCGDASVFVPPDSGSSSSSGGSSSGGTTDGGDDDE